MDVRSGKYYMDSTDLWNAYGLIVTSGIDDFLKFPERKESITHDWLDRDGIDVDLTETFLKEKDITLQIALIANNEADFWDKYEKLLNHLRRPGTRRLEVTQLSRSFFVFYKSCSSFTALTRIKNEDKVACKFTLVLTEKEPSINATNVYLSDENGRFIVT